MLSGPGAFAATLGGVNLAASAVFVPTGGCSFTTTLGGAALSSSGLFATSTAFASPLGGAGLSLSAAFSVPSAFTSTLGGATLSASAVFSDHSSFSTSLEGATLSAIGSTSTDPAFVFRSTLQSAALSSSVLVPYVAPPVIRIPPLGAIMYQDDIILILDHDDTNDQGGSNPNSTNTYLLKASVQPDRPIWEGDSKSPAACTSYTVRLRTDPNIGITRPIAPGDHIVFGSLVLTICGPRVSPGGMRWGWLLACEQTQQ